MTRVREFFASEAGFLVLFTLACVGGGFAGVALALWTFPCTVISL